MVLQFLQSAPDAALVAAFPKHPPALGALEKLLVFLADIIRNFALNLLGGARYQDLIACTAAIVRAPRFQGTDADRRQISVSCSSGRSDSRITRSDRPNFAGKEVCLVRI